jgi:polysaccharide deacetylase family protein (PEP-CTERM system associated)
MWNALSVDVEETFQATEVGLPQDRWESFSGRVVDQTRRVLELFEKREVSATFFILGWVAHKWPHLVREIVMAGHEIGCHSYAHRLVYHLTRDEFFHDTRDAVSAIADACGAPPRIYRAPSYSITADSIWALEILAEQGFTHDSSIYPIFHDRYGIENFGRFARPVTTPSGTIMEIPVATVQVGSRMLPVGGGGYLRLLPYRYTAAGVRRLNERDGQPACIYFHPWELDAGQPRLPVGAVARLRTYRGLGGMEAKIDSLISEFRFRSITGIFPMRPGIHSEANPALETPADHSPR